MRQANLHLLSTSSENDHFPTMRWPHSVSHASTHLRKLTRDESGGQFSPLGTPEMKDMLCHHHHVCHSETLSSLPATYIHDTVGSSSPENCPTTAAPVKGRIVATQRRRGNHMHSAATPHHHHHHTCSASPTRVAHPPTSQHHTAKKPFSVSCKNVVELQLGSVDLAPTSTDAANVMPRKHVRFGFCFHSDTASSSRRRFSSSLHSVVSIY